MIRTRHKTARKLRKTTYFIIETEGRNRYNEIVYFCSRITSQKAILEKTAREMGFHNTSFYVDDGCSGTNFNRPAFKQMIADIEEGKIGTVLSKDLSRLGRNYIESGSYIEIFFPQYDVRYIAVNDGVDTINSAEMDITPFKNISESVKVGGNLCRKQIKTQHTKTWHLMAYAVR